MKGYVQESILYIFDHTPQDLSNVEGWEMPADVDKIYIQTEYVEGFKELNPDYADIMFPKNFCIMQYYPKPEEKHFEDDVNGNDIEITGDASTHFTLSSFKALENETIIVTPESPSYFAGNYTLKTTPAINIEWDDVNKYWIFTMPDSDVSIKTNRISPIGTIDWGFAYDSDTDTYSIKVGNNNTRKSKFEANAVDVLNFALSATDQRIIINGSTVQDLVVTDSEEDDIRHINLTATSIGLNINFYLEYDEETGAYALIEGNPRDDDEDFTYSATTAGVTYSFVSKIISSISWSSDAATVTIGEDDNVFPLLINKACLSPICYYSGDAYTASIDISTGAITLNEAGTTEITAVYYGDYDHASTSADYTLTVEAAVVPYDEKYLTFEALEDTTFSFSENDLQYSLDEGSTWSTLTAGSSTPTLHTGDIILWKQTGLSPTIPGIGRFSSTGEFNVYGNIMSLYYGDDFVGETSLAGKQYAFLQIFKECTGLVSAENLSLPATTLDWHCYFGLFEDCTSLIAAPTFPPVVGIFSHAHMFYGCTSLTTAPALPATSLTISCYQEMFENCTSLTTAPELPATNLEGNCYTKMFKGCTSLTTAPALPATSFSSHGGVYQSMFENCTSLTTAPVLPATTLTSSCYDSMFKGCTSLNYIKCLATDISASDCTNYWLGGVSQTGAFVKDANMSSWTTGDSGIPSGWVVQDDGGHDYSQDYLTFEALENGTFSFSNDLQYSLDNGSTWTTLTSGSSTPTVNAGDKILWKQTGLTIDPMYGIGNFSSSGSFNVSGNIMSLLYGDNFIGQTDLTGKDIAFLLLFTGAGLVNAENLILPATTLSNSCYASMFNGCTSLTTAPELPATTLVDYCYYGMFEGCTSLTTAPELPATTLAEYCYQSMFGHCTSLISAPELPATTLADYCYQQMFYGCASLNYIKMMATDISATDCLNDWTTDVAASGTFIKNANAQWSETGVVPSGWTVQTASAA